MSIVHKAVTAEVTDDLEFVLSDGTVDRYGDTIVAEGWDLRWFKRNPIALFGHDSTFPIGEWADVRVEGSRLLGRLRLAGEGTSARIDELRRLVAQKVLKAVSVGFKPVESERLPGERGGIRFIKQELLECSLVSVPANPAALAVAKAMVTAGQVSLDTVRMAFGEHAARGLGAGRGLSGEHAAPQLPHRTKNMSKTLSERIQDAQDTLTKSRDDLTAHVAEDDADAIVTEELSGQVETATKALDALKRAESALAAKAAATVPGATIPGQARKPLGSALKGKPSDTLIRAAVVQGIAFHMRQDPSDVLARIYGQDEGVEMLMRAAVAPATTTTTGWAAELVNTVMSDFLETLRPESVYPALAEAGGGRLTFGPEQGAIKIPSRAATPSIGGSFIGEGGAIPVRRLGLTSLILTPRKMGVITTFTREMARYSRPAIESLLRQEIVADTALTLDGALLDNVPADGVRPAGLLNGVTALTATAGGGQAAFLGDIKKLRASFDAINAASGLMLLMSPSLAESLALSVTPDGQLGWADTILTRYRIATSTAIPLGRVIMVRATDFVSATGDVPEFELSNDATVHMEDSAPTAIGTAGTPNAVAAPVRSFFQTGVSGLRMLMDVSWGMRRGGMVQYLDSATW